MPFRAPSDPARGDNNSAAPRRRYYYNSNGLFNADLLCLYTVLRAHGSFWSRRCANSNLEPEWMLFVSEKKNKKKKTKEGREREREKKKLIFAGKHRNRVFAQEERQTVRVKFRMRRNKTRPQNVPRNIDLVSVGNISADFQIVVYLSDWFSNLAGQRFAGETRTCRSCFLCVSQKKKKKTFSFSPL